MTEQKFLEDPLLNYYNHRKPISDDWIARAWETDAKFRSGLTYGFERDASKIGTLEGMKDELEVLVRALPIHRVIEIYMRVRERSSHRESEFRPTFTAVLGEKIADFPAPLAEGELEEFYGEFLI